MRRNGATIEKMKKKATKPMSITILPEDIIVEIVAQLVSLSPFPFADLNNLKQTCKIFSIVSNDKMVKERIALEKEISALKWTANELCMPILKSCANAENAEACFILALINIFDREDIYRAVELLKKATCKGHKAALYMMYILSVRLQKYHLSDVNSCKALKADQRKFDDYDQLKWCRETVLNVLRPLTWNKWEVNPVGNIKNANIQIAGLLGVGMAIRAFVAIIVNGIMSILIMYEDVKQFYLVI